MAGHSQFKNIMYRKGAQDAKRAKIFAKIAREITVAARSGLADPDKNSRLRAAVLAAKVQNMPKDRIERAIRKAEGGTAEHYEEVRYEGFGPGGVALIVEGLTDNRNRTAAEVRAALAKFGGSLGETGSVSYQFDHAGLIRYAAETASDDDMLEAAIEAGAQDCARLDDVHEVYCAGEDLHEVREAMERRFGEPQSAELVWRPQTTVELGADEATSLFRMLDVLDDNDDVQHVFANFEVDDAILAELGN